MRFGTPLSSPAIGLTLLGNGGPDNKIIIALQRLGVEQGQSGQIDMAQTQPVGLGKPPYLVMGFIGPVSQSSKISF